MAYLITFRCYGSWLHGDERGSVDRKQTNGHGCDLLPARPRLQAWQYDQLAQEPVSLNGPQRIAVSDAIRESCAHRDWCLHALNVRTNHVHAVVTAQVDPERVMNVMKSRSTRRLRESGLIVPASKVWARHGSTRYLWDQPSLIAACRYVVEGQDACK